MMNKILDITSEVLSLVVGGNIIVSFIEFTALPELIAQICRIVLYLIMIVGSVIIWKQKIQIEKLKEKEKKGSFFYKRDFTKKEEDAS